MKSKGLRALLVSASLLGFTDTGSQVLGNRGRAGAETVLPVATSYVLPTSYVVPTSYAWPTSYVYPTSYVATSYAVPTVYASAYEVPAYSATSYVVPTYAYRRRLLAPRRWVARPVYATTTSYYVPTAYVAPTTYVAPTSYVVPTAYYTPTTYVAPTAYYTPTTYVAPTSYVYPTIYDAPVVAMANSPCDGLSLPRSSVTRPAEPVNRAPRGDIESTPAREAELESNSPAPPADETKSTAKPPGGAADEPPPNLPAADDKEKGAAATPPAGNLGNSALNPDANTSPPPVPSEVIPLPTAPATGDETRREVRRPAYGAPAIRRGRTSLVGKVVSGDSGYLEEGVQLVIASRTNAFTDRVATTNASGRYAVELPDGDWTVNVVMPSGRVYPVSQLTVSGGQITDDLGRNIPSLTITR